ncbi:MUTS isoform 1 [Hibiscus syriacus]|uniref:MUTS isoform 1 n=1 Tax=Hibiscus syriacus TaxID=106335 RepID=A0A6A3D4A8_HIBSY|nr:MUTS isoform 1 [Hibiscus syriacus]
MYPSHSNGCCSDPMAHSDHSCLLHAHVATDPSLPFFNFPSPYYNQCELQVPQAHDVFLQHDRDLLLHNQTLMEADSVSAGTIINVPGSCKNEEYYSGIDCSTKKSHDVTQVVVQEQTPRKRSSSSKGDRHSKINTANGPRDRRMRLSLDVAREFFGLQDMLGYDKASRTVEWLLIRAREEIKKLAGTPVSKTNNSVAAAVKSPSSTSEGELVSTAEPNAIEKRVKQQTKTTFNPLARDLRYKARARARAKERTKAKKTWTQNQRGSLESAGEESGNTQQDAVAEVEELGSRDIKHLSIHEDMIDESSALINKWSPNSMLNCLQNSGIDHEVKSP